MTREEQFLIWILFSRFTNYFNDFTSARQCRWVEYSGQSSSDESFQEHFCLLTCFNPRLITQLLSSRHKWRRNGLFRCCQRLCHKKVFLRIINDFRAFPAVILNDVIFFEQFPTGYWNILQNLRKLTSFSKIKQ